MPGLLLLHNHLMDSCSYVRKNTLLATKGVCICTKLHPPSPRVVSKSVYAKKDRNGPSSANQGLSTNKPRHSHAVYTTHTLIANRLLMRFMTQAIINTMVLTKVTVRVCWTEAQCLVQLLLAYFSTSAPTILLSSP